VAAFTGSPTSGCAPLNVNFTDQSTGDITSWSWTFGDGGTSTAQSPSHSYAAAGNYTVSLTATGPGGSDGETKTNYVSVSGVPVSNFTGSPTSGQSPLTVNFTDQTTGGATSWSWDFGDAGTSSAQNPSHVYASAGIYTVSLTASNTCGSDGETKTAYITVTAPPAQQCDDFADGNISNWVNSSGTWTATGGFMKGNSTTSNARRTSPFGSFGATAVNVDLRFLTGRSNRQGRLIWGYVNSNNYRFLQGDDVNNRWRIYERVNGVNTLRLNVNSSISTNTWYDVTVTIAANGSATFAINGVTLGTYNFSAAVTGLVGCGYNNSNCDFDNFCVGTSGGAPAVPFEEPLANVAPEELPDVFEVYQNYPNPFNPKTEISFFLPEAAQVSVEIFNILGQRITTLLDGQVNAGLNTLTWNSEDEIGVPVSSGIYFYRILVEDRAPVTKKMILIK
ncbi:MAG TPA: PKD domain-containing protein, partial [candidate division Zixibacteria bacterium]|nr:PKD domain-containing protein [candidate division Zixibacteria bacterium]